MRAFRDAADGYYQVDIPAGAPVPKWAEGMTEVPVEAPAGQTPEQIVAGFVSAMEAHYDAVARGKNYDNRFTCALRAGYAGPFQSEGQAFAIWMDGCNALAYSVLAEVQAGTRAQPTVSEFIAMLPVAPW